VVVFAYHSPELLQLQKGAFLIEFTELLALIAGIFRLRRHDWARWLALAWMAFHVKLTAFPPGTGGSCAHLRRDRMDSAALGFAAVFQR
jgi:hypothetical protein